MAACRHHFERRGAAPGCAGQEAYRHRHDEAHSSSSDATTEFTAGVDRMCLGRRGLARAREVSRSLAKSRRGVTLEQQIRALLRFIGWGFVTLLFITYIPWLSLVIPSHFD
jgi:hypothetical protein